MAEATASASSGSSGEPLVERRLELLVGRLREPLALDRLGEDVVPEAVDAGLGQIVLAERAAVRGSTARRRRWSFGYGAFVEHPPRGFGASARKRRSGAARRIVVHMAKDRLRRFAAAPRASTGGTGWRAGILDTWTKTLAPSGPTLWIGIPRTDPRRTACTEARGWRAARCSESRSRSPRRRWRRRRAWTPTTTASCPNSVAINSLWVIVAGCFVMFMQAGLRLPRDRLLARQERRDDRREDPRELLDRGDHVLRDRLRVRLRRRGHHRPRRVLPARLRRPADGVPGHGPVRRDRAVEVVLPVHLLRRLAGDRLGHDARADQVRRVHHLRDRLRRVHLPDRVALGLRRRLAAVQHRHAGLRRLDGRPHDRRDRRPGGAAAARSRGAGSTAPTASRGRSPGTTCRCSAWRS